MTVTSDYISNVITTGGAGTKTMKYCLQVAKTNLLLTKPCYDTEHLNLVCDETCHLHTAQATQTESGKDPQDSETKIPKFPDILSVDGSDTKIEDNKFIKHLRSFLEKNKDLFSLPKDMAQSFKGTRSNSIKSIEDIIFYQIVSVNNFIRNFWGGIQKRLKYTDLDQGSTCFSEAPAEGVFSVIEKVIQGRESFGINLIKALTRISLEGPGVATNDGYDLSKEALGLWGGKGERFTTATWVSGLKQKAMVEIQEGKRKKTKKDE